CSAARRRSARCTSSGTLRTVRTAIVTFLHLLSLTAYLLLCCHFSKTPATASQAGQLHALRPRLHRPGAEDIATNRRPVRLEVVTYVLGTLCPGWTRGIWRALQDSNL